MVEPASPDLGGFIVCHCFHKIIWPDNNSLEVFILNQLSVALRKDLVLRPVRLNYPRALKQVLYNT